MAASKSKRRAVLALLLSAMALSFTLFVFAPIEQYVLNQSELWFGLGVIVPMALASFALVTLLLTGIGCCLRPRARRLYTGVLLALAVCFYLQGNLLNPDYGELDGRAVEWEQYTVYGIWSGAVWVLLLSGGLVLAAKLKKRFSGAARMLSGALLLVQAVTLAAVLLTHPLEDKRMDWIVSDKEQFTLGREGNTVVFVVDACDSTYLPRLQAETPDALAEFTGFTWFSDHAGAYSKTKMGLPYLLTGVWYENDETIEDYLARCYAVPSVYPDLRDAGWRIGLYTAETYLSRALLGVADNVIAAPLTVGEPLKLWGKMLEFVAFRYAPHVFKPNFVFYSGDFGFYKASSSAHQPYFKDNFRFRDKFERDGLTLADGRRLLIYHINGSHLPCNMDAQGVNVGSWNTTAAEQTKGVFRTLLAPYLQQMKALGVYESANILITADHGRFDEGPSSPLLLVKPAYAEGALTESTAMSAAGDLLPTLRVLCGIDAPGADVLSLDPAEDRPRRYLYYPTTRRNSGTLPPLQEYNVGRGQVFTATGVVLPGGAESLK